MSEERRQILEMVAEQKIGADEAERLIAALDDGRPAARPKYLRVLVDASDGGEGNSRINVRVPLELLRAGVRLAALVPPHALARANAELDRAGVPIDLTELKPQDLEALIDHLGDVTVDVDDPDAKVQVYCE
ncbi:hypothetical protein O4J56_06735 [Nocardiopsis sp. RSe5-2]|uniref:YvlB/LiaX N-terminal domain-containing protein n=1 Tax=Nocardiopsis endophytica TaxID=3018445 RepID=A0ABT4U058_9ACTN|nr:hypothetical protein [Nocardiopsis endophytica]MDA2810330.1 hypothetical protein [Nocardiopsis endophytica]